MPQSLALIVIHLIFSTKQRTPWLDNEIRAELHPYIVGILNNIGCTSIQIGGVEDHVHILFGISRTMSVAQVVEKVKTASTKWLKGRWEHRGEFAWQSGYAAYSVSATNMDATVRYIRSQEDHHHKTTFQEEYRKLLEEAGIGYDERYLWD